MLEKLFGVGVAAELPALLRYATVLCRDEVAAEDLVQDTILRACEAHDSFQHDRQLRPWLFSILHNRFISARRREKTEREKICLLADEARAESCDAAANLADLACAMEKLPGDLRAVLQLVAVNGFTYREAADVLSIPVGTVMSRLSRARKILRGEESAGTRLHVIGGRHAGQS